jgi:hypothetical protein
VKREGQKDTGTETDRMRKKREGEKGKKSQRIVKMKERRTVSTIREKERKSEN